MQTKYFDDPKRFQNESVNLIYKLYEESIGKSKLFTLMLSGGRTPLPVYEKLVSEYKDKINWKKVHIFWGDERYVDQKSKDSNFKWAYDLLISKINIPTNNVHRIKTELTIEEACEAYEKEIISFFRNQNPVFDLILLGIGEDGHTASLFPSSDTLKENKKLFTVTPPSGTPKIPRITATYKLLNNARNILFLCSYKGKEQVIDTILNNPKIAEEKYPAAKVKVENTYFFIKI
ncbi:6-phosphogluconolactonase [Petrotoga olearia]|uniref:6-phosphogluconolactonase n=2 Tax=Petrotoga olearia TaxID=156203 RepID=A0A2K1P0V9_9BACT|nr:6-phosphogluconolactonase [Petrotoga olearia]PNR96428.1 6-phosphogluconolactonase [Petrotoga olearia DSM 13574]RMA76504.1 6-phosphogluconolactonase [Petrotoga olearia]